MAEIISLTASVLALSQAVLRGLEFVHDLCDAPLEVQALRVSKQAAVYQLNTEILIV
jgi:hypothetical protein